MPRFPCVCPTLELEQFVGRGHETQRLSCMILYPSMLSLPCPWPMGKCRCVRAPLPTPLPCIAFAWQCFRRSGCVPAEFCKSSSTASASASPSAVWGAPRTTTLLGGNSPASATSATSVSREDGTASSLLHHPAALRAASMAPGYVVYDTYMKSKPTGIRKQGENKQAKYTTTTIHKRKKWRR